MARSRLLAVVGCLSLSVSACAVETIVHRVPEKEANEILELLEDQDISVTKGMIDTGREQYFTIAVSGAQRLHAIKLLNEHELPARPDRGYDSVFGGEGGLIPSRIQEAAQKLSALEGEIERQLKLIVGVLDVEVQLVMPEESPLDTQDTITPTTASVTIKYLPGSDGSKPLSEPQVRALVAAGVEKLTPDYVVVAMVPSAGGIKGRTIEAGGGPPGPIGIKDILKMRPVQMGLAVVIVLVLLLCVGLMFSQMQLKNVRGRLIRLQNEIAKARRRPGDGATA